LEDVCFSGFPIINLFFRGDLICCFGPFFSVGLAKTGGWWHYPSTTFSEERDQAVLLGMVMSANFAEIVEILREEERNCCGFFIVGRFIRHP
jgi:hypothetical protein